MRFSIIIVTRNRACALQKTLESLAHMTVRPEWEVDLVVVDNASTDETASVVRSARFAHINVTYLYESSPGKSSGLNTALRYTQGEIILFTDDDVLVAEDWAEQMIQALSQENAAAVVGRVVLSEDLLHPWLSNRHMSWLAAAEQIAAQPELIGANMGFHRYVLTHVPGFDPELGPGAIGFGEETLFGKQLIEAGFKIKYARNAVVVHRPEITRLRRGIWLETARKLGRKNAYIQYHWEHDDIWIPRVKWLYYLVKLHVRRLLQPQPALDQKGAALWEINYMLNKEACHGFCLERRRERNYARRGIRKRGWK